MKTETEVFLEAADRAISNAKRILVIEIFDQAARLAYYAQFYAAQALIFERLAKVTKTHKGVNGEFHKLLKGEPSLPSNLAAQLSKAYRYKEVADYDTGTASPMTKLQVGDAIITAERFVAAIRQVLMTPP